MLNKKGFTLVEIIVVIVILGLLITLTTTSFFKSSDRLRDKIDQIALNNLRDAAILYAKDMKLKDCDNCLNYSLNMDCVSSNTVNNEKSACRTKNQITVSLGYLKQNNYFQDTADKCYKLDASKNKISDNSIQIVIYRYSTEYYVELGEIYCAK